jgi:Lar family restriction alleviation protein
MSEELKPCPFCGGEAKVQYEIGSNLHPSVVCTTCLIRTPKSLSRDKNEVKNIWNTRQEMSEEEAKETLKTFKAEREAYDIITWDYDSKGYAKLDGSFTPQELIAIATLMEASNE